MNITLHKATDADAKQIYEYQKASFQPLLDKYLDMETNPANEPLTRTQIRINRPDGGFYKIMAGGQFVGAICIFSEDPGTYWISPMFVHPSYQGKGIAQQALKKVENMFSDAKVWRLATLREEKGNCYLYEKAGYQLTGKVQPLNVRATFGLLRKMVNIVCVV
ncbi:GNAT family N-acetyltransferase [Terribacillus sp. 179-K 1B1 HS]